ncbi:MAG: helix-turn-helix domain-containing protein [Bacteroidales bacterium]|nr:helix-turn-helix domain-containing protein [Bacteroidales bacterium]
MEIVIWVGFSIALFAGIVTVTKNQVNVSDKLLSAWLFLLAIDYGNIGITSLSYDLIIIPSSFFLFNPAFYLYSRSLTDETFKLKWVQLLHLIPYLFFELSNHYYILSFDIDLFFIKDNNLWIRLLFSLSFLVSLGAYNTLSISAVHKHRINLKNEFSTITQNQKLGWLLFIVISYIVYILIATLFGLLGFLYNDFEASRLFNYSATLAITSVLGFYGIRQDEIYKRIFKNTDPDQTEERYKKSKLTTHKKEEIKTLILKYFKEKTPYLNSELSMLIFSEELHIPKHQLTEVLNTVIGKNFFQFVNEQRVEAVKQKLSDPGNDIFSIEAIGYDCGFSSKSSFFSVFKSITGQTPLQFKSSIR